VRAALADHPEWLHDHRPLFEAVRRDRADVAALLLDLGMSPDVEEPAHRSRPLHVAGSFGAERCAALLIERGADADHRERNYGAVLLGMAFYSKQLPLVRLLGRHSRAVWELTYTGLTDRLREVLSEEPERARACSENGDTPLMWLPMDASAALAAAKLLVEHGADVTRRNSRGLTAAEIATQRGLDDVAALLGGAGADTHGTGWHAADA
jgi:uncharacterized protein